MKKTILILLTLAIVASQPFMGNAFPISIKDDLGNSLTLSKAPQRIVSAIPSITEILAALGLGDRLIAVTDLCNYPQSIARKPRIGATPLNIERISYLNPDLVVLLGDAPKKKKLPILRNFLFRHLP